MHHSSCPPVKFAFDLFPGDGVLAVSLERRHAPPKLSVLRRRQAHVCGRKAIPKLADQVEPFARCQSGHVERLHDMKIARGGMFCE